MNVFIITEGTAQTGYGHLTRCLAMYQGFEEKGIIPTIIANCDENGKKVLCETNLESFDWIIDQEKLISIIKKADIAIIDSYLAEMPIYEKIHEVVKKSIYIDDTMRINYPPGIIINGTVGAENLCYQKDDKHMYLLGLEYTPLRKAFWDIPPKKQNKMIENVLITIGGQDIRGITFKILDAVLNSFPSFCYHVVIGYNDYQNMIVNYQQYKNVTFYQSLNAEEMRDLMLKCDLAISAAGQTTYELARTYIKTIALGVAENQLYNIRGWLSKGFIKSEIWYNQTNYLNDINIAFNIYYESPFYKHPLLDGQGVRRIVNSLL